MVRAGLTTRAMLLALTWLERVRCAIGCVPVIGVGALTTLGDGAHTFGAGAGVCMRTLGVDAGVGAGVGSTSWMFGGPPDGKLKIARRLSTVRSWAWQLSGVRSARMAIVSAQRQ